MQNKYYNRGRQIIFRRRPRYFSAEKFYDLASARLPPALRFGSLSQNSLHRSLLPPARRSLGEGGIYSIFIEQIYISRFLGKNNNYKTLAYPAKLA